MSVPQAVDRLTALDDPAPPAPPAASPAVDRARVLGCAIDRLDMAEMVERIDRVIAARDFAQHAAVNAAKLVAMREDPELERIVSEAELISADGQSVVWASRVLSDPLPSRVAGIDLMFELFALAERRGYRVFILGARDDVLERALGRLHERHPALVVAGARDGYFSDDDDAAVAAEVAAHRPDIVFVAMPSPRKEYWLGTYGRRLGAPFIMGVGGSIDVLAGHVRRAPVLLQRLGLEWLFRLAQEPRRMFRRYLWGNTRFIAYVAGDFARRHLR
jgi:N-acetylglucosaminyldiphosphoundecaprenol N-acetyl-beta-D-mannosaminyltransferase